MDLQIANALELPIELVWFSRQSYAEDFSSSSTADWGTDDWPCQYGGHFPETSHDLGSDGTQSPGRDDTDDEAGGTGDDYTHALFAQEQMMMDHDEFHHDRSFDIGADATEGGRSDQPPRQTSCQLPAGRPPSPDHRLVEISYTPCPQASAPSSSPVRMDALPAHGVPSQLRNSGARRPVSVAPWQSAALRAALARDGGRPGRAQLRELAQRTHLPVSVVSCWFVQQRRISFHRAKFGFYFTEPASRPSRAVKISATDNHRRH